MIPLSLAAIAEITGARPHLVADPAAIVDTVVIDSRAAGPGALFAALPGRAGGRPRLRARRGGGRCRRGAGHPPGRGAHAGRAGRA